MSAAAPLSQPRYRYITTCMSAELHISSAITGICNLLYGTSCYRYHIRPYRYITIVCQLSSISQAIQVYNYCRVSWAPYHRPFTGISTIVYQLELHITGHTGDISLLYAQNRAPLSQAIQVYNYCMSAELHITGHTWPYNYCIVSLSSILSGNYGILLGRGGGGVV